MIVFHKDNYIEDNDVKISINSPGFQYGMGFFTTLKYIDNEAKFLKLHCERIYTSCKVFNIDFEIIDVELVINKLIKINKLTEARIKIIIYVDDDQKGKYLIIPQKLVVNNTEINVRTVKVNRGDIKLYQHKSLNYFENIFNKNMSLQNDFDDYIFYNENGLIMEATTSNIFFMKNDEIFTPKSSLPILNGIVRKVLLESNEINSFEEDIDLKNISDFDSCFLTNSIQGIVPVKSISHERIKIKYNCINLKKLSTEILKI